MPARPWQLVPRVALVMAVVSVGGCYAAHPLLDSDAGGRDAAPDGNSAPTDGGPDATGPQEPIWEVTAVDAIVDGVDVLLTHALVGSWSGCSNWIGLTITLGHLDPEGGLVADLEVDIVIVPQGDGTAQMQSCDAREPGSVSSHPCTLEGTITSANGDSWSYEWAVAGDLVISEGTWNVRVSIDAVSKFLFVLPC